VTATLADGAVVSGVAWLLDGADSRAGSDDDAGAGAGHRRSRHAAAFPRHGAGLLVHEGGRWSPYDAHYLPGPETAVTRISEPANYRDSAADPAGHTVLCAEIPCAVGDTVWGADDEALGDLVEHALEVTGLPPVRRAGVVVRRVRNVYPVYTRGYEGDLARLEAWASTLARVTTFGRHGLFAHAHDHQALAMAYAALDALGADGGWDLRAWSAARERFAAHVVDD
jgi:hypothetical protein